MNYNMMVKGIKEIGGQLKIKDKIIYNVVIENVEFEYNSNINKIIINVDNELKMFIVGNVDVELLELLNDRYINIFDSTFENIALAYDRLKTMIEEYNK